MDGRKIAFRECVESGADGIGEYNSKLDDTAFETAMRAFPLLCADIYPINRARKVAYLAPRNQRPKLGWWTIGGRVFRGEPVRAAALRKLKQETGLVIEASRLQLVAFHRYVCADREQLPQNVGTDTPALIYTFEPTEEELEVMSVRLDKKEYEGNKGMRAFTRAEMFDARVDPALVALYDDIFGT